MIYLTGQLLAFLIVTASVGFVLGWLLRGAILPGPTANSVDMFYPSKQQVEKPSYLISGIASEKGPQVD